MKDVISKILSDPALRESPAIEQAFQQQAVAVPWATLDN